MASLQQRSVIVGHETSSSPAGKGMRPIRIRILFGFWITTLVPSLVVAPGMGGSFSRIMLWGAIFFASILAHEIAHAVVGLCFGHRAMIVLHPLGGLTQFEPRLPRGRALLALVAGPVVSLLIGFLLASLGRKTVPPTLSYAMSLNIVWGVINLLPILPFDGGRALVEGFGERRATAVIISAAIAFGAASLGMTVFRSAGVTFFFLGAGVLSAFEWAKLQDQAIKVRARDQLTAARLLLQRERTFEARSIAEEVARRARDLESRNTALTTLAWAWLGERNPRQARDALARILPASAVDAYTVAAVENADGHPERAIAVLERQRRETTMSREAARFLVDLYAQGGDLSQAAQVASDLSRVLGPDDLRTIAQVLERSGEHEKATALTDAVNVGKPLQPEHAN